MFLVSRGHAAIVFQSIKAPFGEVAEFVTLAVVTSLADALPRENHGPGAWSAYLAAQVVAVVTFVRNHVLRMQHRDQRGGRRQVLPEQTRGHSKPKAES